MKTLRFEDGKEVSVYEDDTIGRVRELLAIKKGRHPDRLFLQVLVELPGNTYTRPKEWTDLFFRLSRDGITVSKDVLRIYTTRICPELSDIAVRDYDREQWEEVEESDPLRARGEVTREWHILGTREQPCLPDPPQDVRLPTNQIPLPALQSLVETIHPFLPQTALVRATELPADPSDAVLRNYFPYLRPDTPSKLEDSVEAGILKTQADLARLLALPEKHKADRHASYSIVKAKWYIPLNASEIPAPRAQLEQMFYGLTLSPKTPYAAYFTSATEGLRNKYYVKDPTVKEPLVNPKLIRGWYTMTQPQRRRPTLLLYRGDSRYVFQRIAIGATSITIDIRKEKGDATSLEDLKAEANTWLQSLDAVIPFLDPRDIAPEAWDLSDLSLHAVYAKDEPEFDLLRFPCLYPIFGLQAGVFRLLRAEPSAESVSPQLLQAFQVLSQEGSANTPEYLAGELDISLEEATSLLTQLSSEDLNVERALKAYPTIKFVSGRDVLIRFATNVDRVLTYVDILRIVLTRNSESVNDVCPRRQETVEGVAAVPQDLAVPEAEPDEELMALLGLSDEPAAAPVLTTTPTPKSRKLKVAAEQLSTQNYFNARLLALDPELFKEPYSATCEKARQVVVLTPTEVEEIKAKKGAQYAYEDAPANERYAIPGKGVAICPPYWCMEDKIPLRETQLVPSADDPKTMACPVCGGKVRPNDKVSTREYTVIKRESSSGRFTPYPRKLKGSGAPCCYLTARDEEEPEEEVPKKKGYSVKSEEGYILSDETAEIPKWRGARLSEDLAQRLGVTTAYATTIKENRLVFGKSDVFRIGLDRPRDLIALAKLHRVPVKSTGEAPKLFTPEERPKDVERCSFFTAWRGENPLKEIDRAYKDETLDVLHEVEFLSYVYEFAAILVDMKTMQVVCGFRKDITAATSYTVILLVSDISDQANPRRRIDVLGTLQRSRERSTYATKIEVDAGHESLRTQTAQIVQLHKDACSVGLPTLDDALTAFSRAGVTRTHVINDPYGRTQAILAAGIAFLPCVPTSQKPPEVEGVKTISYADLKDPELLPTYESQMAFLATVNRPDLYAKTMEHRNASGQIVEIQTVSGLRIPVQPTGDPAPPQTEVTETMRLKGEEMLVSAAPSPTDREVMEKLDYESELYEFLLFSIAKTIRIDVADPKFGDLRDAIYLRDKTMLEKALKAWYKAEAFDDKTTKPYMFLSKVRTPCGQLTKQDTCESASLCGWQGTCKVRVRTKQVNKDALLNRVVTTLLTNEKQRALVLDNRYSPFFSTVLYLEMPHELITTTY